MVAHIWSSILHKPLSASCSTYDLMFFFVRSILNEDTTFVHEAHWDKLPLRQFGK